MSDKPQIGCLGLFVLALMLLDLALAIAAAAWAEGLSILQWVVLGSLFLGYLFGRSRLPGIIAHVVQLPLGSAWVAFLSGNLLPPQLGWHDRLIDLGERLLVWGQKALTGGISTDNLVFVMQVAFLVWLLGYLCAWLVFRSHRIPLAILVGTAALIINLYYGPPTLSGYLVVYLLCALFLIVLGAFASQQIVWQGRHVLFNPDIGFDILRDGVVFCVLIILVAWLLPTHLERPSWAGEEGPLAGPIHAFQDEWNRLYHALNRYGPASRPIPFGPEMAFGGPRHLGQTVIMDVWSGDGHYWRAAVYDRYTGSGWLNTDKGTTQFDADAPITSAPYDLRREEWQTFKIYRPIGDLLFAAPQPLRVDLPIKVTVNDTTIVRGPRDPRSVKDFIHAPPEASFLHSQKALKAGQEYNVSSSVSRADVESLRKAGTGYSDWVKARYLQLPSTLPQRVRDLAHRLAAPFDNPYDQATAIEAYLRKLEYDENIAAPPPDHDGVDYFLFDSRKGYCDYYASAMVVLARVVGIPARIASGYATGAYDDRADAYRVREADAHTWIEIFFPRYGWVEFEPTASRPLIVRPTPAPKVTTAATPEEPESAGGPGKPKKPKADIDMEIGVGGAIVGGWSLAQFLGLSFAAFVILAGVVGWFMWMRGLRGLSVAGGAFERMSRLARFLGIAPRSGQTPHEYAMAIAAAVDESAPILGRGAPVGAGSSVPQCRDEVQRIADGYVRERFGAKKLSTSENELLNGAWRHLRRVMLREIIARHRQRLASLRWVRLRR